ncbi:hypothetical protein [Streptomyces termitum]|uniref:hypothetical protein n=1 Tax=Streptomyces termitum TaxID=67368 RepID=UPI00379DC852
MNQGWEKNVRGTKGRRGALAVLPVLLAAAVGCQAAPAKSGPDAKAPTPAKTGKPVFEEKLADQLSAASRATAGAGSARFTSTVSYGAAGGAAVETTTGVLDYAKDTARAERAYTVPRGFPRTAAEELGRTVGAQGREVFGVEKNDVLYRTSGGTWLRYASSGSMEFVKGVGDIMGLAGEYGPWGGTLADLVRGADPERAPETGADGRRTYRVEVAGRDVVRLLPRFVRYPGADAQLPATVPMTVVLDAEGRLLSARLDGTPLLSGLRKAGVMEGVTSLTLDYVLTGHGGQTVPGVPAGERTEDAEKSVVDLTSLKPGACGSTDTGLGFVDKLREVPCGPSADLRVFAQKRVETTVRNKEPKGVGRGIATEYCRRTFPTVPQWTKDAKPRGAFSTMGGEHISYSLTDPDSTVSGDFTCYVSLR